MFYESFYPKNELKNLSKQLIEYKKRFLLYDNWQYNLEKNCFIWFYFIRKLLESKYKITDNIRKISIEVETCKFIWKKRLYQPIWDYDEYDFENPQKISINIIELTHQFIHSQLFFWEKIKKGLSYVYVSSDFQLYKKLYKIDIDSIIEIFNTVSNDFVTSVITNKDIESWKINIKCN